MRGALMEIICNERYPVHVQGRDKLTSFLGISPFSFLEFAREIEQGASTMPQSLTDGALETTTWLVMQLVFVWH